VASQAEANRPNIMKNVMFVSAKALYHRIRELHPALDAFLFRIWNRRGIIKKIEGRNHVIDIHPMAILDGVQFLISGQDHKISIGRKTSLKNVRFRISGRNHRIVISEDCCFIEGGSFWMEDENGLIHISAGATFVNAHFAATEDNSQILIGADCMFSYDIDVRTSDSHPVLDLAGNRLNPAKNVHIEDHVWVGEHCSILKGVHLQAHTVVGIRSTVTRSFDEGNIVIGGSPAKILKRGTTWSRLRSPAKPLPA